MNLIILVCQLFFLGVQAGTFVQQKSENVTLVLVDTWATLETHSIFFDHIKQMGGGNHTLEFKLISGSPTDTVNIQQFNKYFYDNIILMAPTVKSFGSDLKVKELLEFVDFHHNIMLFVNNESRKTIRELGNEFGVDFEDYGYSMHGGSTPEGTSQSAFKMDNLSWSKNQFEPLVGDKNVFTKLSRPVMFEDGVGMLLDSEQNNQHVFPILRADQGAFSYNPSGPERKETGIISGSGLSLVAGYQTRYNQRVVISGSTKMCGNDAMLMNRDPASDSIKSSPNYILCTEMVEWNLMERGVLKMSNIKHNKVGDAWDGNYPENYKRQVDIEYFADFEMKQNGKWVPYVADDIQFQFTMLDPYYQVALERVGKSATYTYKLKTPWRLGIFKFAVDYKRYGMTYINSALEVSVIQLRHDEFPRYETTGYPYYANVFVLMACSFLFVTHFAFSDFSKVNGVKKA